MISSLRSAGTIAARGVTEGLRVSVRLLTMVIPLYIVMDLLKETPLVTSLASLAAPVMRIMDLPGDAAIPFVIAGVNNLYAGIGAMAPLGLSPRQVTIMGIVLGISHNLIVETGVLSRAGTRGLLLAFYRVTAAVAVGWIAAMIMPGGE